ncbi:MAG: TadE family protein [Myxococcota bacterium]
MSRQRRAAQALEFALTAPILMLIGLAGIEVAWMLLLQACLDHAVFIGARAGAIANRDAQPVVLAKQAATRAWQNTQLAPRATFRGRVEGDIPTKRFLFEGEVTYKPLVGLAWFAMPVLRSNTRLLMEDQ